MTWRRTMEEELKAAGLTWGTAARGAQDRGSGEILCEPYVPHGTKRISKVSKEQMFMAAIRLGIFPGHHVLVQWLRSLPLGLPDYV